MNVDVVAVAVVSAVVITGSSHRLAFRPPVLRRMDGRARFKTSCFVGLPVLQGLASLHPFGQSSALLALFESSGWD
jgi:hypothetical protein